MRTFAMIGAGALALAAVAAVVLTPWAVTSLAVVTVLAAVTVLVGAGVAGRAWLVGRLADRAAGRAVVEAEAEKLRAEAEAVRLAARSFVATASPGHQVYLVNRLDDVSKPLHLSPGRVNGHQIEPSTDEANRWGVYASLYAPSAKRIEGAGAVPLIEGPSMPPLLPKLVNAQRLIIAGGSDAGKTTLVKHLVAGRADHSLIIPIDPHAPSKILGFDVIGAGRDYEAIGGALESLLLMMTARYDDVRIGTHRYGDHQRVSVFIDEWTSIKREVAGAGDALAMLLTESRKVNIHLTLCAHSLTVDTLGIDAQIRNSAVCVELFGGETEPRRAFVHPQSKTNPDGGRAKPLEHQLPGPFPGFVQPGPGVEIVATLPDARILKAQMMEADGESITAIARAYFGVEKASGRHLREVRELLREGRQERDKATS